MIPLVLWESGLGLAGEVEYDIDAFADPSELISGADHRRQAALLDHAHDAIFVRDPARPSRTGTGAEDIYVHPGRGDGAHLHDAQRPFPEPLADIEAIMARDGRWEGGLPATQRRADLVTESRWPRSAADPALLRSWSQPDITARGAPNNNAPAAEGSGH